MSVIAEVNGNMMLLALLCYSPRVWFGLVTLLFPFPLPPYASVTLILHVMLFVL